MSQTFQRSNVNSLLKGKIDKILNFQGALVASLTPYDKDGNINANVIPQYVKYLKDSGVDGVFMHGTTGEGFSLTLNEKISLAKVWIEENAKQKANLLITINVTSTCIPEAVKFAQQLEALGGVDAIAVLPPLYYKPGKLDDIVNYLQLFADAAPNLPILYYYIPSFVEIGVEINALVGEALKRIPAFCGMKFSHGDFVQVANLQKNYGQQFKVMCGFEELLLPTLSTLKVQAAICAMFNFQETTAAYKEMLSCYSSDLKRAQQLHEDILMQTRIHKSSGNFFLSLKSTINKNLKSLGLQFGSPRAPISFQ